MKRELAMFHAAQVVHKQLLAMDEQLDRMALAVLPPEERLPKPVHFGGKAKHEALSNQIRGLLRCVFMSSDSTDAFRHFYPNARYRAHTPQMHVRMHDKLEFQPGV